MNNLLQIFVTGIIMGNTVCMLSSCAMSPILYITASGQGVKHTVKSIGLFSLSRIAAYSALGAVAGGSGLILSKLLGNSTFNIILGIVTGVVTITIGITILLDQEIFHFPGICRYTSALLKKGYSMVLLGALLAIIPCVPFTSLFTQVMIERGGLFLGAVEGFLFGIGISLSVPFWLLAIFSGSVPRRVLQNRRFLKSFKIICGLILVIIGTKYMIAIT